MIKSFGGADSEKKGYCVPLRASRMIWSEYSSLEPKTPLDNRTLRRTHNSSIYSFSGHIAQKSDYDTELPHRVFDNCRQEELQDYLLGVFSVHCHKRLQMLQVTLCAEASVKHRNSPFVQVVRPGLPQEPTQLQYSEAPQIALVNGYSEAPQIILR